jgi:aldose 1-epimerase
VSTVIDPSARTLAAGELEAVFLPGRGMLGASLRHRGDELLGRVDDLEQAVAAGATAGIPLLHPWANRLAGLRYEAVGRVVELDPSSPLLHFDANGLPIHGVPWSQLSFGVTAERDDALSARLEWATRELLAVFPFPHLLELDVALDPGGLTIETTLTPAADVAVPVAFGFHPYFALPGTPRIDWVLSLPAMTRLELDAHGVPTGATTPFAGCSAPLDDRVLDDGFAAPVPVRLEISGGGRRIAVELEAGYPFAQVFAPASPAVVALEPMTAPANALASGDGLRLVEPGASFAASFRIVIS